MSRGVASAGGLGVFGRGLAIGAPAVTALTLAAIVGLPPSEPDDELQLLAPERVTAGAIVPLRAHVYAGVTRPEGPELAIAPVRVEVRGRDRRVWASSTLRPGFGKTLEGELRVPPDRHGAATLLARGSYDGVELSVERELRVDAAGTQAAHVSPQARELPPLRSLAILPVRELAELDFAELDVRVRGGVCVPEAPCDLVFYVGPAAITPVAEPSASVSVAAPASAPPMPVIVRTVTAHGPEAQLAIRIDHDGQPVARSAVRLPLALGSSAITNAPDVVRAGGALALALTGEERGCIVDAFREGRWARSVTLRDCRSPEPLPGAPLEPGLWRLQLRRDRFTADSAAVHDLYVASSHESDRDVTRAIARAVLALEPHNGLALALAADGEDAVPPDWMLLDPRSSHDPGNNRYFLAVLEAGIYPLPEASSGRAAAVLRLRAARGELRRLGLLAILACALTLTALLGQRGLAAAGEASRLLEAAGTDPGALRRARMRMALRLVATLCALLLAFAAIAAYVVARAASL